ncbi:hypothetical protein BS47DRAFT_1368968 [Hydnum rufescens UP504]|uniref:Uncharacterized protein n=1 Tax=Hydnum rufescens UP504 TaxID=1448309 RepID=A0A9P6DMK0_9AGAM|nr:hypothetical protein BS47DRAFT_1368968 [Hydnum rufescens UP504]
MARKKVPPSANETRATGKSSILTNDPPAPNRPNTRSSANVAANVDTVNIKAKPSGSRIVISDNEVDMMSDDDGDLLELRNPSFILEKSSKRGAKRPVPRLRGPNVPIHFDRRLDRQKRVKPPSPSSISHVPLGVSRHTSLDDDAAVQDAVNDFPADQFDESDDTTAGQELLNRATMRSHLPSHTPTPQNSRRSTLLTQPGDFHNIDDVGSFGDALNNALGAASPQAHTPSRSLSPSPSASPSFEDSSSNEDYMDALTDAISTTAADENKYEALKDKEFLKSRMEQHTQEWTEIAGELGIETEDVLQYVSQRLYGAENPGHGLSSKELSALYSKEKAKFRPYICFVRTTPVLYPMARKKVPPSANETRATGKSSILTNDPPAPNRPNTRSSANVAANVDTVNIKAKPSGSRIVISDNEVDMMSDDDGDLLELRNPSFILEKSSKRGAKRPVPRLRGPNVPIHFDRRLDRQKRVKPPSPSSISHVPLGVSRHTSLDDDAAVQDAVNDFPADQFDESDDTTAGQELLNRATMRSHLPSHTPTPQNSRRSTLLTQPGDFHNIDDVGSFGDALNNALGAASPQAHTPSRSLSPSPSASPSFEDSSSNEDYMDALTDAISTTAADENKYEALVALKKNLLQKKRARHVDDSRAYREWRASQAAIRKGKGKEGDTNPPPRRRVITKKDKEFLKSRMEQHTQEWTEIAGELGIETEDVLQYVSQRLYGAENPGHGLSSKELSALYSKEKAKVASEGKEQLEEWYATNKDRLEKLESDVVWTSMSSTTRTNMMAKEARDLSERARVASNNYQYEIFGIIMNREVLDGQATANAHMFSSSKGTGKILEKHIWSNMELRKKLQLDLINVDTPSADDNNAPTLAMWDAYRDTLTSASGTHTLGQNEVRTAVSAKMTHLLRTVLESQGSGVSIGRGFPWNSLANFIYLNRPSFIIRNWPSTVPFQWVGDMNARQAQLLLQSLIVGFIYKEEGSNQSVLMPNSRIRFEPFNPDDEDHASNDFGNCVVMSDETGRTLMRIKDSAKWRDLQVRNQVGHEKKVTKRAKEASRTRGRAQTEVNIVRRKVSDDQGSGSDDHPRVRAHVPKLKRAKIFSKLVIVPQARTDESDDSEHNVRIQVHSKRAKAGTRKSGQVFTLHQVRAPMERVFGFVKTLGFKMTAASARFPIKEKESKAPSSDDEALISEDGRFDQLVHPGTHPSQLFRSRENQNITRSGIATFGVGSGNN